jgi:hypothetical protein
MGFFSLYVGVAVLIFPQGCNRGRLLFVAATFFSACVFVGAAFFSTRLTWHHAEEVRM